MRVRVILRVRVLMRVRGAFVWVRLLTHHEFGGGHAGAEDPMAGDPTEIDRETAEGAAQVIDRQAQIEERADDHVAGGAGETVEVERLCQPSTPSVLAKTEVLHIGEDDVIEHFHTHQDPRGDQSLGQPHIIVTRLRVA